MPVVKLGSGGNAFEQVWNDYISAKNASAGKVGDDVSVPDAIAGAPRRPMAAIAQKSGLVSAPAVSTSGIPVRTDSSPAFRPDNILKATKGALGLDGYSDGEVIAAFRTRFPELADSSDDELALALEIKYFNEDRPSFLERSAKVAGTEFLGKVVGLGNSVDKPANQLALERLKGQAAPVTIMPTEFSGAVPKAQNFSEHLAGFVGTALSDLPFIAVTGAAGGMAARAASLRGLGKTALQEAVSGGLFAQLRKYDNERDRVIGTLEEAAIWSGLGVGMHLAVKPFKALVKHLQRGKGAELSEQEKVLVTKVVDHALSPADINERGTAIADQILEAERLRQSPASAIAEGVIPAAPSNMNQSDWLMQHITGKVKSGAAAGDAYAESLQRAGENAEAAFADKIGVAEKRFGKVSAQVPEQVVAGDLAHGDVVSTADDVFRVIDQGPDGTRLKDGIEITVDPWEPVEKIGKLNKAGVFGDMGALPKAAKNEAADFIGGGVAVDSGKPSVMSFEEFVDKTPYYKGADQTFKDRFDLSAHNADLLERWNKTARRKYDEYLAANGGGKIETAAALTDVNPTEAQKVAGNYAKGSVKINGMDISIENPAGSVRSGVDGSGKAWSQTMRNHYGYIKGTKGPDKDHVDVFFGPEAENKQLPVFVVNQVKPGTKVFDEPKAMIGFSTAKDARDAYLANFEPGWNGFGGIKRFPNVDDFKKWVFSDAAASKKALNLKSDYERLRADDYREMVGINKSGVKPDADKTGLPPVAMSLVGGTSGFERDEKTGKMKFNPAKAAAGMVAGLTVASVLAKKGRSFFYGDGTFKTSQEALAAQAKERLASAVKLHGKEIFEKAVNELGFDRMKLSKEESFSVIKKMDLVGKNAQKPGGGLAESVYEDAIVNAGAELKGPKGTNQYWDGTKDLGNRLFVPISSRLQRINENLGRKMRGHEYSLAKRITKDLKSVAPLVEATKKLSAEDAIVLELARKNGDMSKIRPIIEKYKIVGEYNAYVKTMDEVYRRAKEVGFDIGYRQNYHPRMVKDKKGFLKYFEMSDDWSVIEEAIKNKETALQRTMTQDEKVDFINSLLRGFQKDKIGLPETANMLQRKIEVIDRDLNRFYYDSNSSLAMYLQAVNDRIESRRFFGAHWKPKKDGWKPDAEDMFGVGTDPNAKPDLNDSIGSYVLDLMQKGEITATQENELRSILQARFHEEGTHGIVALYKNLSYMETMGSFVSALTQLGDVAFSLYRSGVGATARGIGKAVRGKGAVSLEDLGIQDIAHEFHADYNSGKVLTKIFKWSGLSKLDQLGKETYINSLLEKYNKQALNPDKEFMRRIGRVFGKDSDSVIADLKEKRNTENVRYLLFNDLLDIQPVALSEMPENYLNGGNGRIFYMLKTYGLKQWDLFRREAFDLMENPETRAQGLKNLMKLSAALVAMNAGADAVKNLVMNRDIDPNDMLVDNILRLTGLSKWTIYEARQQGIATAAMKTILPPAKALDAAYKDTRSVWNYYVDGKQIKGFELPASVPIVGKPYYWWLGKGSEMTKDKQKNSRKRKMRAVRGRRE